MAMFDTDDDQDSPTSFPLKLAPSSYIQALERCWQATGYPGRKACLIAIDGLNGAGKTSFATWLAWQLGTPCLSLDDFRERREPPFTWRCDEINRLLASRLDRNRPIVMESVFMLDALQDLGRTADLLIYVESEDMEGTLLLSGIKAYIRRMKLPDRADVVVRWQGDGPLEYLPFQGAHISK